MKSLSCSSTKNMNKLTFPKTKNPSLTHSFNNIKSDISNLKSKKSGNLFYYKNPQFLNDSNIQKQINILLTNVSVNKTEDKLPRLIFDADQKKFDKIISVDNPNITDKNNNIDELPEIKIDKKYKYRHSEENSKSNNNNDKSVDYTYKNIFTNTPLFKSKESLINNKLNLVYCQNESQYKFIMEKRKKLKGKGRIIEEDSEKIKGQIDAIKTKVKFMKNVIDYSYPNFFLSKIQIFKQNLIERKKEVNEEQYLMKYKNNNITNYLKKHLKVYPLKIE